MSVLEIYARYVLHFSFHVVKFFADGVNEKLMRTDREGSERSFCFLAIMDSSVPEGRGELPDFRPRDFPLDIC